MMNRDMAGTILDRMGLRRVDQESWMGFQRAGGRDFPVFANLKEVYIQVMVPLNLFTRCDQLPVYQYLVEVNSRIALGKFAVGPAGEQGGRPIVLAADLPTGLGVEYTSEETVNLLFRTVVDLLETHFDTIESLFRQGCRPSSGVSVGRALLDRLRVFRAGQEGQKGQP